MSREDASQSSIHRTPLSRHTRAAAEVNGRGRVDRVILENGAIRTIDASLPLARALAIAGDRVAGGVGAHETALATPEVVDLGGRCVLPGFTDSHVHFPTWATALSADPARGGDLRRGRRRADARRASARSRRTAGSGRRASARRTGPTLPTKEMLDAVTGDVPAAVISKDFHAIWLNSAGIARTGGDLRRYDVPGGVVELGADGEPTGLLREESAWRFKEDHLEYSDDEYLEALREGLKLASSRGRHRDPRQGRLDPGDPAALAGARARRTRCPSACGSRSRTSTSTASPSSGFASGLGSDRLRLGYLKVFMDGTLGSRTALMTDGTGVEITTREELADIVRRGADARLAGRRPRDRRPREPERARRVRGDARRRGSRSACATGSSTRSACARRTCGRFAELGADGVGAVLPRAVRRGARPPLLGRPARRRLLVPLACSTPGRA